MPASVILLAVIVYACNNKLNLQPQGSLLPANVTNNSGVQGLLIGAYALLSGENVPGQTWETAAAPPIMYMGNECADDAYKGSTPSDQPDAIPLMTWSLAESGTSSYLDEKWVVLYTGIQRANDVIRTMRQSPSISPADTVEYEAEARFLRGYYHFEGKKIFNNFPYVNELIQYASNNLDVPNSVNGHLYQYLAGYSSRPFLCCE